MLRPVAARAQAAASAVDPAHPRVVLLAITEDDPLAARLAAELEALGLHVTRALINPAAAIEDIVKEALSAGARGVVVADGRRTEFWIAEEGSDRVAMRQELEIENTPALESVLSLRTVEFLRVSLGLVGPGPRVPPAVVAPPPVAPRPPDPRAALALTTGVVASTGSIAPFAVVAAAVRVRVIGPLGVEVRGAVPLGVHRLSTVMDDADVSVWMAGGGLVLAPRTLGPIRLELGAGVLAAILRAVGVPGPGILDFNPMGFTDHVVGLAAYGRASGHIRLGPRLGVRLELLGGSTQMQRPIVTFVDEGAPPGSTHVDVAVWGVGFVSLLGGIEATF